MRLAQHSKLLPITTTYYYYYYYNMNPVGAAVGGVAVVSFAVLSAGASLNFNSVSKKGWQRMVANERWKQEQMQSQKEVRTGGTKI